MDKDSLHSDLHRRFSSRVKSITLNLGNFRYNHKDNPEKEDLYIHREQLEYKLESWLLNKNKSGSYLVTGYRGMGKSSLVNHVLDRIVRPLNARVERVWNTSIILMALTFFFGFMGFWIVAAISLSLFLACFLIVIGNRHYPSAKFNDEIANFAQNKTFDLKRLKKLLSAKDTTRQSYKRIKIKINLGKEIMNERDVLCLITGHIKNKYEEYLTAGHNKPFWMYLRHLCSFGLATIILNFSIVPLGHSINDYSCCKHAIGRFVRKIYEIIGNSPFTKSVVILIALLGLTWLAYKLFDRIISLFDHSQKSLKKLTDLSDRLSSSISESDGNIPNLSNSFLNISLFGRRNREIPSADIRDIEAELIEIIKTINSRSCIPANRVQFFIVLDELDKAEQKDCTASNIQDSELTPPEFSSSIDGFTEGNSNTERRKVVLQMLGNMKLFLTTANAKFIFISGRELYDAFLADISDREYAISSIFSGVLNVSSFLYPEREQSDISSLTEQYVAETLLPENYLWKKAQENAQKNGVIKKEIPSLRWYIQYLTELAEKEGLSDEELRFRKEEIRHITIFLKNFIVYLSHVSNGAPKKIVLYFEKYIKRKEDLVTYYDWPDNIECGVRKNYALYFTPEDQQKIGFISYLAAPIMDVITNNVSNYDDKLLVEASFLIDHLFKFHGRGFSWRNIELTPELLDVNKTPELRDFITSIMEFMQQLHISSILVGLFQFKFRKRISEELSYISRVSDEAAAMFNFTLNESHPVKQYYAKLLNYYLNISQKSDPSGTNNMYGDVISRIHISLANLYFMEENYSRALQEYRCAINYLDRVIKPDSQESLSSIITRVRCMLKMGLTCEYSKNYETAYVIYCNLVDAVISVREVDERKFGLQLVDRWTHDWRIKQPMVVDPGVMQRKSNNPYGYLCTDRYYHQIYNLVWDDAYNKKSKQNPHYEGAEYSLNFENLISGFSKNLSPEKSHIIAKLSLFEDVRLIYKAILAKLFIIEKMNMNGITLSNIEVAEAEFKYLHRTTNVKEKFFLSCDFLNELGKIVFYKNSLNVLPGVSSKPGEESLRAALYWWNIDIYAYLDEFCFYQASIEGRDAFDAVTAKEEIVRCINKLKVPVIKKVNNGKPNISELLGIVRTTLDDKSPNSRIIGYLNYISKRFTGQVSFSEDKLLECSIHRSHMRAKGWNLPCHACRYLHQSLDIMINSMFEDFGSLASKQSIAISKSLYLLEVSFRKNIKYTRVNHLRLLASNIVSMGNIQYSCSDNGTSQESKMNEKSSKAMSNIVLANGINNTVLTLIRELLNNGRDDKKTDAIKELKSKLTTNICILTKLDKALLYYVAAYRYYNIAQQYKDAGECLLKILRLIQEYVTLINFNKKIDVDQTTHISKLLDCLELYNKKRLDDHDGESYDLLEVIMIRLAKCVAFQYGFSSQAELNSYRWILHLSSNEDLDFRHLHTYTELKEALWQVLDTRIKIQNIRKYYYKISGNKAMERLVTAERRKEIEAAYGHFKPIGHIRSTFYDDVFSNYARFRLNKLIVKDIFGRDPMVKKDNSYEYEIQYMNVFITCLTDYLSKNETEDKLDSLIFYDSKYDNKEDHTMSPKQKTEIIEFLLEDSIVCLSEIVYSLPPYNHISSFSNSFIAEVYSQLWEYSKMYETLGMLYDYQLYKKDVEYDKLFKKWGEDKIGKGLKKAMDDYCEKLNTNPKDLNNKYGSLRSQFFTRLRHSIDDRTMCHFISNYAAEMALKYYALAESSHSEGEAYKNYISRNYVLNDDLNNDTWFFNTTVERFRLHTNYIQHHRRRLAQVIRGSRFYRPKSYITGYQKETDYSEIFDTIRFDDSLNINSEL